MIAEAVCRCTEGRSAIGWNDGPPIDRGEVETVRIALARKLGGFEMEIEDRSRLLAVPRGAVGSWLASRRALLGALESLGPLGGRLSASISHSDGAGLAAVWLPPDGGRIGVDLERLDRALSPGALARIRASFHLEPGEDPLAAWCVREALFKADPQTPLALSGYRKVGEEWISPGGLRSRAELVRNGRWMGAVAACRSA